MTAPRVELEDLQYRLAISSLGLLQSHGALDKDFANWALETADSYSGNEPNEGIRKFLRQFVAADIPTMNQLNELAHSKSGVGSNLKTFQIKFLESNLTEASKLPISVQQKSMKSGIN